MSTQKLTIGGLERWVLAGAHWRVLDISRERVVVELCTCMGEPVERLESADPDLIAHLRTARRDLVVADPIESSREVSLDVRVERLYAPAEDDVLRER